MKLSLIRCDPVFATWDSVGVEGGFRCPRKPQPASPHCIAFGKCLLQKECGEFPFSSCQIIWLGLALPQEPSGHRWSRAGPRQIVELGAAAFPWLEGHSGTGLRPVHPTGLGKAPSLMYTWKETGNKETSALIPI